jgi:hypothetical protein
MTLDIAGGVRARLAGDDVLAGMLASYQAAPAIFTDPVPDDFETQERASIVVAEPHLNESDNTFSSKGRRASVRARIYAKPNGSTAPLLDAAERARSLFNDWSASDFGGGVLEASFVSGPVPAPTDDPSIEGRLLTIQLVITE